MTFHGVAAEGQRVKANMACVCVLYVCVRLSQPQSWPRRRLCRKKG